MDVDRIPAFNPSFLLCHPNTVPVPVLFVPALGTTGMDLYPYVIACHPLSLTSSTTNARFERTNAQRCLNTLQSRLCDQLMAWLLVDHDSVDVENSDEPTSREMCMVQPPQIHSWTGLWSQVYFLVICLLPNYQPLTAIFWKTIGIRVLLTMSLLALRSLWMIS